MMMMIMEGLSDDPAISSSTPTKLPGFRFHPTEEELLSFYLKTMVFGNKFLPNNIIGFLNIYNYDPSDLPRLAKIGEREWYFFVPRDRKHGSGGRPNRTTQTGFWKATGSDRKIITTSDPKRVLGLKKTLVFYQGRAPHGSKTNWVMNEYRLPDKSTPKDIVLCKIYMKATSLKVLEQRAAMEEDNLVMRTSPSPSPSFCNQQTSDSSYWYDTNNSKKGLILKKEMSYEEDEGALAMMMRNNNNNHEEEEGEEEEEEESRKRRTCLVVPGGKSNLTDLQLPNLNTDWTQDSFWTQLSPWLLDHLTPSLLNY